MRFSNICYRKTPPHPYTLHRCWMKFIFFLENIYHHKTANSIMNHYFIDIEFSEAFALCDVTTATTTTTTTTTTQMSNESPKCISAK